MKTMSFSKLPKTRRLQIEALEERQMLAVSVAEFNQIRAAAYRGAQGGEKKEGKDRVWP